MATYAHAFGPHAPDATYIDHAYEEHLFDTGEVVLNHVVVGDPDRPPLLLIPGQTESWWGYEAALPLLAEHFQCFAVDLRGQGRSSRTPGRYTFDNMGNDLVRFIDGVIGRPTYVSGLSSGGVLSAWLSAYARPGQVIAAHYEDPPLFACLVDTPVGPSLRQTIGPIFDLMATYLGDQWRVGDWDGMVEAAPDALPAAVAGVGTLMLGSPGSTPHQNMKEYDPEWGRAFWTGTVSAGCDHARMLAAVKVPVLFTHHGRIIDEATGSLLGATSDLQAQRVRDLVTAAGQPIVYRSLPDMGHSMHGQDPKLFTEILVEWVGTL